MRGIVKVLTSSIKAKYDQININTTLPNLKPNIVAIKGREWTIKEVEVASETQDPY